jgi:hypothetical protein
MQIVHIGHLKVHVLSVLEQFHDEARDDDQDLCFVSGGEKPHHRLVGGGRRNSPPGHLEISLPCCSLAGQIPLRQFETRKRDGPEHHNVASPLLFVYRCQEL